MNLSTAAKLMNGQLFGDDALFFGAATDTRLLKAGQLFFAWKGEMYDAHLLLEVAASSGAIAAVVEHYNPQINLPQILVKDSQKALGRLAKAWRKEWHGLCFALTGSNGKTTLKEMIASICTEVGKSHATAGNLNNHIGCPLTLMGLKPEHQFGVIEMGANHPKEISYLTHLACPDIAILNNAGMCHLEGFIDIQGVATAKAEIFEGLTSHGTAVINLDDPFGQFWINHVNNQNANIKIITFGFSADVDVHLINPAQNTNKPLLIRTPQGDLKVHLNLLGIHNIRNCLAAVAAAVAANIPLAAITSGLEKLIPVKGRLQEVMLTPHLTLINDGYNANPSSLKAGIDAIIEKNKTNIAISGAPSEVWLILGDMLELGEQSTQLHFECGQYAKQAGVTQLFAIGTNCQESCRGFGEGAKHFQTHNQLIDFIISKLTETQQNTTLLTKGSFSMNMAKIVDALVAHFAIKNN